MFLMWSPLNGLFYMKMGEDYGQRQYYDLETVLNYSPITKTQLLSTFKMALEHLVLEEMIHVVYSD